MYNKKCGCNILIKTILKKKNKCTHTHMHTGHKLIHKVQKANQSDLSADHLTSFAAATQMTVIPTINTKVVNVINSLVSTTQSGMKCSCSRRIFFDLIPRLIVCRPFVAH